MAAGPSKARKLEQEEPKDLNLVPIMNLFIVVIPMLLMITVSAHMAMLQITLPSMGGAASDSKQAEETEKIPEIKLGLYPDRFEIQVEDEKDVEKIPVINQAAADDMQKYDYTELDKKLSELKKKYEKQESITIVPDNQATFQALLLTIDICKMNQFPNISYKPIQKQLARVK